MVNEVKKNDFVELKYTGFSDGKVFDSNIEEDLKQAKSDLKPRKVIIIVGQAMLIPGLDKELFGKEVGKEYRVNVKAKEGFGERNRELVKVIPLKVFTEKQILPKPGMVLNMDYSLAKVLAVSGARVTTDFNHPMAGKDLEYKFTIVRKVEDEKEKCDTVLEMLFRNVPEYEIKDKIVIKGPKGFDVLVNAFKEKFKEFIGKELAFELIEKKEQKKEEKVEKKV